MTEEECTHECSSCGVGDCSDRNTQPEMPKPNAVSTIKHVIGVVSGKGGVGKSLVTALIASKLQKRGLKVGIFDADITGPSIPKVFGIDGHVSASETGIVPQETASGIKIMSTNLMLPQEDIPVAWRGPVLSGVLTQFWTEVDWGDIDVMLVDMPPGTSDVFLTVFHTLPVDGIITVSAPQELVSMIVGKAVNLAHDMEVKVLGLVENMAYFVCDECNKKHYIYGQTQVQEIAKKYNIPSYATLPIDSQFATLCDEGRIEEYDLGDQLDAVLKQVDEVICE